MMWPGRSLDQDWVDRANGFWSVLLLSACSLAAFLVRYVTQPISCWIPLHFTAAQANHLHQHCFLQTDSLSEFNPALPDTFQSVVGRTSYHLWIPLILFLQALCFKIPSVIWQLSKSSLTFNYDETVTSLESIEVKDPQARSLLMQNAARLLSKMFQRSKVLLSILYMILKIISFLNLIAQFIFLTILFGHLLPLKPIQKYIMDVLPSYRVFLPQDVLCAFRIRQLQNVVTHTVPCQLSISEIYEKLFVFLWFWVFFLALATFINLVQWAGFLFIPFLRDSKISAYITSSPGLSKASSSIRPFVSGFLGIDGVLMMSMISQNSSEMVAASLSQEMYKVFLERNDSILNPNSQPFPSISRALPQPYAPPVVTPRVESVPMETMPTGSEDAPQVLVEKNQREEGAQAANHQSIPEDTPPRYSAADTFVPSTMEKPLIDDD